MSQRERGRVIFLGCAGQSGALQRHVVFLCVAKQGPRRRQPRDSPHNNTSKSKRPLAVLHSLATAPCGEATPAGQQQSRPQQRRSAISSSSLALSPAIVVVQAGEFGLALFALPCSTKPAASTSRLELFQMVPLAGPPLVPRVDVVLCVAGLCDFLSFGAAGAAATLL